MIKIVNLSKNYQNTQVIKSLSLEIETGVQLSLQGSSGSGKSTFLYLLGGIERQTAGSIRVNNLVLENLSDEERASYRNLSVGFIFQFHFLLPSLTCLENILLPAKIAKKNIKNVQNYVTTLAHYVGVHHQLNKYPHELSGGEQQRINLLRAISLKPDLILADEATGNLDSKNSDIVTSLLIELALESKSTLIMVTHEEKIAKRFNHQLKIEDGKLILG